MDLSKFAAGRKKFMSKDLWNPGQGEDLTIARIDEQLFTNQGKTENKLVVSWVEDRPPYACNVTNMNWVIGTYGPLPEHWQGKKVHVFHDPTVEYPRGKRCGGVVFDLPRTQTVGQALAASGRTDLLRPLLKKSELLARGELSEEPDDNIPF